MRAIPVNYSPEGQKVWNALDLMVLTHFNPHANKAAIGNQIRQIGRTIPRAEPSTVEQQLWHGFETAVSSRDLRPVLFPCDCHCWGWNVLRDVVWTKAATLEIGVRMALDAGRT